MLKASKGETSVGLIIGMVLLVAIVVGLVIWSRSNKTATVDDSANVPVTTTDTSSTTGATPTTTTTTTTTVQAPVTPPPALPKTGFGPDDK